MTLLENFENFLFNIKKHFHNTVKSVNILHMNLRMLLRFACCQYLLIRTMDSEILWAKLNRPSRRYIRIELLPDEMIRNEFRFENKDLSFFRLVITTPKWF